MPITVISDIHGLTFWKEVVARTEDRLIFLGDYFDHRGDGPWARDQKVNFLEICDFVRSRPGSVMLLGNHDIQYLPGFIYGSSSKNERDALKFRAAMEDNADLLAMATAIRPDGREPVLFTHAGVSETFMLHLRATSPNLPTAPEMALNEALKLEPELFDWQLGSADGDDVWQSPTWIRPNSLLEDALPGYVQVVGHTYVREPSMLLSRSGEPIWFTCCFTGACLRLDDNGEAMNF